MQQPFPPSFWKPSQRPPSFHEVQSELRDLLALLFRALEFGAVKNHAYFDELSDGERPRPHVREMVVRDHAARHLRDHKISVEEDLTIFSEALRALVVRHKGTHLRVLKARNGIVPGCGLSKPRRRFYNQSPTSYKEQDGTFVSTKWNLLLLWDFDSVFNIGKVWLVFPTRAALRSAEVGYAWIEELQHPVTNIQIPAPDPDSAAQDEQELRDLLDDKGENEEKRDDEAESA